MTKPPGPLARWNVQRTEFICDGDAIRQVFQNDFVNEVETLQLASYVADRAPLFYRKLENILEDLKAGLFLTAFQDTLKKIPTAESFQESHFAEIVAGVFGEDVQLWHRLYSKLSLLTAENSNAYKMDLLFCNPYSTPVEFIFGEVKSSCKSIHDGMPPKHHESCYPSLFQSFNKYESHDERFDLTAARDNIQLLPEPFLSLVKAALLPYGNRRIRYAGFVVIDRATRIDDETSLLAKRKNETSFNVELICIDELKQVITQTFDLLSEKST